MAQPDREVDALTDLLPSVGLNWLVSMRPPEFTHLDWLKPTLARLFKDERLDALAQATGLDVREVPELVLASYRHTDTESAVAYLVRHRAEPQELERKFRVRLTSRPERREFGHQLIALWGLVGQALLGFVRIGPHVVSYQYGGQRERGPNRIAVLYAESRLGDVAPVSKDESLMHLASLLGPAALTALMPGPFQGTMARGARGLMASATAVGLSLHPTEQKTLRLRIVLDGDYAGEHAREFLEAAWSDVAQSSLGHLLGFGAPASAIALRTTNTHLELEVELDADRLSDGLAAATTSSAREFMR